MISAFQNLRMKINFWFFWVYSISVCGNIVFRKEFFKINSQKVSIHKKSSVWVRLVVPINVTDILKHFVNLNVRDRCKT